MFWFAIFSVQSVLGIILGGGAGTRLYPLTKKRAKPAVPLGANYRLIDIPVSNCLNSNISKIYVLTQFNSASLNRHLSRAYASNMGGYKNEGFVEVLAAQQSPENPNWFQVRTSCFSGVLGNSFFGIPAISSMLLFLFDFKTSIPPFSQLLNAVFGYLGIPVLIEE